MISTKMDVLNKISGWLMGEFGTEAEWIFDEDGELVAGEPLNAIGIAYCQYEGMGDGLWVEEQWYADVENLRIYLELDDREVMSEEYGSYEEMEKDIEGWSLDWFISEADNYIIEHREEFKEA